MYAEECITIQTWSHNTLQPVVLDQRLAMSFASHAECLTPTQKCFKQESLLDNVGTHL